MMPRNHPILDPSAGHAKRDTQCADNREMRNTPNQVHQGEPTTLTSPHGTGIAANITLQPARRADVT
jgi:hypothetical protein